MVTSGTCLRFAFRMARRLMLVTAIAVLAAGTFGCALATIDTMRNQKLDPNAVPKKTRAVETVTAQELSDGIFIGIALSGGGSRAANFSSAVLLELDKLGILDKATAISSVSGSSLPAAYYGLYRNDKTRWNPKEVRRHMMKNFELRWIGRWFLPQNITLYWSTNFNRSDIMKEVLDSNLFHGSAFGDMGDGLPRILINATSLSRGERFVFSEERFNLLQSRMDTYPVANAVMASSAFPAAFHDMTLIDYSLSGQESYQHVLDGGPSDNLGTTTLLEMITELYQDSAKPRPKGCFLFVVDAYPYHTTPAHIHEADTRNFIDFIFDTNIAASSDALLTARRLDLLNTLNVVASEMNIVPFQLNTGNGALYPDPYNDDLRVECAVWHLSLQRLLSTDFANRAAEGNDELRQRIMQAAGIVNAIPTRYTLTGKGIDPRSGESVKLSSAALQDYLFDAARYLIRLDKGSDGSPILHHVCEWFKKKGLRDLRCEAALQ